MSGVRDNKKTWDRLSSMTRDEWDRLSIIMKYRYSLIADKMLDREQEDIFMKLDLSERDVEEIKLNYNTDRRIRERLKREEIKKAAEKHESSIEAVADLKTKIQILESTGEKLKIRDHEHESDMLSLRVQLKELELRNKELELENQRLRDLPTPRAKRDQKQSSESWSRNNGVSEK